MSEDSYREVGMDPPSWKQEFGISDKEQLAAWMIRNGFATGHGDSFEDLLHELTWQVKELKDQLWSYRKEKAS
jgi:hypothetical protein